MTKLIKAAILFSIFYLPNIGFAQHEEKLYFIRNTDVPVIVNDDTLKYPWAGGMNNPQFSNIDLNQDGVLDLFVFERSDNQPYTFISNNEKGKVSFTYAPEHEHRFPALRDWAILADFNNDGAPDIFTYIFSGVKLFQNTTATHSPNGGVSFKLKETRISSFNPKTGNEAKVAVTAMDIPGIGDVDGDGDLDFLTFGPAGMHIEYHENQCKDKGKDCQDLDLSMVTRCWGNFAENEDNNGIELNAKCIWDTTESVRKNLHVGSTMIMLDTDEDGDKEILLGDKSSKRLVLITNGGDKDSANISEVDTAFPPEEPVNLDLFPAPFYVDINNDKVLDLVAAVNVQEYENIESCWYYENEGTNNKPKFKFKSKNLLQGEMIDVGIGSNPTFFDYNNDGLLDLLIASYNFYTNDGNTKSRVHYFENVGTKDKPAFKQMSEDWEDLHKDHNETLGQSFQTTFGDVDGDGDNDMFVGTENGELFYFENKAEKDKQADFEGTGTPHVDADGNPMDVGVRSSPELFDLNEDGLLDLIVGERNGNLNYYENQGTKEEPKFKLVNQKLGGVNLNQNEDPTSGQANPKFFVRDGKIELLVGSEFGTIYYYDNIKGNLEGEFNKLDTAFQGINKGFSTSIDLADLNDDGFLDLVFGTEGGGARLYLGAKYTGIEENKPLDALQLRLHPNPANTFINISFDSKGQNGYNVKVNDILGKEMFFKNVNKDNLKVNIDNFPNGIYFVTVYNDHLKQTSRFIKGN